MAAYCHEARWNRDLKSSERTHELSCSRNAYQCGQNQSGSGFVSSSGRVVTNAHVVAGVTQPVVLTPSGSTYTGRVVYFNAVQDLAVIAVNGLPTAPLPLGADLVTGATAVFDGYPLGGPFLSSPAAVQNVATINSPDIYGANPSPREVYYLAADVQEGSGVRLQVTDHGAGIPEAFRARFCQRFAQADMNTSRPKGGSGLGLSIAKQMIEQMGGSIGYSSEPGRTCFHVVLPAVP